MTFWYNKLFITTLKSQKLYMVTLEKENDNWKTKDIEPLFEKEY
jgi:hypothetical protein